MASLGVRAHFERRIASRRRQMLGLAGLVLLMGIIGGYRYLTRPERVRHFSERFLVTMTGGLVQIESAKFDLFEGLHLTGVAVAVHPSPMQPADTSTFKDRVIFSARDLYLRIQPFSLITGDLAVPEIIATEPEVRLLRDLGTDARNWQYLLSERKKKEAKVKRNPTIRLRDARVVLAWTPEPGKHAAGDFPLDVTAICPPESPSVYDIRWRTRSPPVENGRFAFDLKTLDLHTAEGGLPTIPMASIRWASPRGLDRWLDLLDLNGQIRTDRLSYEPESGGRAELAIENASLAAIVTEEDRQLPRQERYLTFADVKGRLSFEGPAVGIDVTGTWRGGTCRLSGRVFGELSAIRTLDDVGFDLRVRAENILLPNGPGEQSPAESRFIAKWPRLGNFMRLYSPIGRLDIDFSVAKQPGRGQPPSFRGGELAARGSSAAFLSFPYRLSDLTGRVRFDADGPVHLENLTGRHGDAVVSINGTLTQPQWWGGLDLQIVGRHVALDNDLRSCLAERYRSFWQLFEPQGQVGLDVRLTRAPSTTQTANPWQARIHATLEGISACYTRLPLPLTDVRGELDIDADRFLVRGLRGRYRDAAWTMQGAIIAPSDRPADIQLDVAGHGFPVDEKLLGHLPPNVGVLLRKLNSRGTADLAGYIFSDRGNELAYDIRTSVRLPELCLDAVPLPLVDTEAVIHAHGEGIEVEQFTAKHGDGRLELAGQFALEASTRATSIAIRATDLPLTANVFGILPPKAQDAWRVLGPSGSIDVHATLALSAGAGRESATAEVEIRPKTLTLAPTLTPITFTDVGGTIRITPASIAVTDGFAKAGQGSLRLDGRIDMTEDGWASKVRAEVTNFEFSDGIRRALPWRLQRVWTGLQPKGRFDLLMRRLDLRSRAGKDLEWSLDGRLTAHGLDLAGAGTVRGLDGSLDLRASVGQDNGTFGLEGTVDIATMEFGDREITDFHATLAKTNGEALLRADDLKGALYGGTIRGFAELDLSPNRNTYGVSVVVDRVQLPAYLQAARASGTQPAAAHGLVSGKLFLSGTPGDIRARRGGGTFHIEEAEVMKMPVFLSVMSVLNLAPPDENAFHEGDVDFTLQGETLTFSAIDLRGRAISLVGAGHMTTSTHAMEVSLIAGSPRRLPRLGLLSELADAAAKELLEVQITGTLERPHVESKPLRGVSRAIELVQRWRERSGK